MVWEFDFLNALQSIHNPVLDKIMWFLSTIGEYGILWITISFILLIPKKYRRTGLQLMGAMFITFVIGNLILKNMVHRIRPCWIDDSKAIKDGIDTINVKLPKDYSFPSGHSMNGITAAVTLLLNDKRIGIPAMIVALGIAFSRLYAYMHFPTDIISGMIIGLCCALITDYVFKKKGWKVVK